MGKQTLGRAGRPIDVERTKEARTRHANGVKRMRAMFGWLGKNDTGHVPPKGARWPARSTFMRFPGATRPHGPNRQARIRTRKAVRAARRANR